MLRRLLALLLLLVAACSGGIADDEPVVVSFAGEPPTIADPDRVAPDPGAAILLETIAPGLLSLDSEGQVEPAIARRWIMLDDGLSYIFRLDDRRWPGGDRVTSGQIAARIDEARAPGSRNRLRHLLRDIDRINAVTPEVVEIVLHHPRADFLQLMAQPDLALLDDGVGLGRLERADDDRDSWELRRRAPPEQAGETAAAAASRGRVSVYFESMSRAVARFELGQADVVLGGTLLDLVYAEAIDPSNDQLLFDPVQGLFGLGFVARTGFLGDGENRNALSMAISRQRIMRAFGRIAAERQRTIIPEGITEFARLTLPNWYNVEIDVRRRYAADIVARWERANGEIAPLRVAMPAGPGARRMFAEFGAAWRDIGIDAVMVGHEEDADLVLIDRVAPTESADWYLSRFRCGEGMVCSEQLDAALDAMRDAPTIEARIDRLIDAQTALADLAPFIPIMRPIRWSLVSSRIRGFRPNRYASHPLGTLRGPEP